MRTPSASSTSAVPVREDMLRLPCLATGTPQAATTNAAAVETLSVPWPSPPVPHKIDGAVRRFDPAHGETHGARGAHDLFRRRIADGESGQERRHPHGRNIARHQRRKGARGRVLGELFAHGQALEDGAEVFERAHASASFTTGPRGKEAGDP